MAQILVCNSPSVDSSFEPSLPCIHFTNSKGNTLSLASGPAVLGMPIEQLFEL